MTPAKAAKMIYLLLHICIAAAMVYGVYSFFELSKKLASPSPSVVVETSLDSRSLAIQMWVGTVATGLTILSLILILFKRSAGWKIAMPTFVVVLLNIILNTCMSIPLITEMISAQGDLFQRVEMGFWMIGQALGAMVVLAIMIWLIWSFRKRGVFRENGAF